MISILLNSRNIKIQSNMAHRLFLPDPLTFIFNENYTKAGSTKSASVPGNGSFVIPLELLSAYSTVSIEKFLQGSGTAFNLVGTSSAWSQEKEINTSSTNVHNQITFELSNSLTTSAFALKGGIIVSLKGVKSDYILTNAANFELNYRFSKKEAYSSSQKDTMNINGIFPEEIISQYNRITIKNCGTGWFDGTILGCTPPSSINTTDRFNITNNEYDLTSSSSGIRSSTCINSFNIILEN